MRRICILAVLALPVGPVFAAEPTAVGKAADKAPRKVLGHDQIVKALTDRQAVVSHKMADLATLASELKRMRAADPRAESLVRKHREALTALVTKWTELLPEKVELAAALAEPGISPALEELSASYAELLAATRKLGGVDAKLMIRLQAAANEVGTQLEVVDSLADQWDGTVGNQVHKFLPRREKPAETTALDGQSDAHDTSAGEADEVLPIANDATLSPETCEPEDEAVDLDEADRLEDAAEIAPAAASEAEESVAESAAD